MSKHEINIPFELGKAVGRIEEIETEIKILKERIEAFTDLVWLAIEQEAVEKFYVELKGGKRAKKSAFLICRSIWTHGSGDWELYMNRVGSVGNFKTKKACIEKLKEIVENAVLPVRIWKQRKGKFELFFESKNW